MIILSCNCGSSSVKYQLYNWEKQEIIAKGIVERVTIGDSFCVHEVNHKEKITIEHDCPTHKEAIKLIVDSLIHPDHGAIKDLSDIAAIGHRVVHGGEKFSKSVIINQEVLKTFKELAGLAPLHNPPNIMGIEAALELLPDIPHMAIMDTAWHQTMPDYVYHYAVPYPWYEKYGIRRYGFHGTSLLYVAKRAAVLLNKDPFECNLISCHIGNGVSVNAVKNGFSYDTSMGFTPLEGAIMGTRAGDHDAALDFYVMQKEGYSPQEMDALLNKKSGLLGITGQYIDRRDVIKAASQGDKRCQLAVEMESYRLKKYIGAYTAALGRVDALVFTAGVGEMSDTIREKVLEGLDNLGIKYDPPKNKIARTRNAELDISADDSKVKILVIPTDEELVFVEDVVALLKGTYDIHSHFKYTFQDKGYQNLMREKAFQKECKKKPDLEKIRIK
jgi:acetate kinase